MWFHEVDSDFTMTSGSLTLVSKVNDQYYMCTLDNGELSVIYEFDYPNKLSQPKSCTKPRIICITIYT